MKHDQVNDLCYGIKYFDLYLYLNFIIIFLFIVNEFSFSFLCMMICNLFN